MTLTPDVARVALHELEVLRRRRAEYDEVVAGWKARGKRAPYCLHGSYQWVDYDAICTGCEDGDTLTGPSLYRAALERAHAAVRESRRRSRLNSVLIEALLDVPAHVRGDVADLLKRVGQWAMDPLTGS